MLNSKTNKSFEATSTIENTIVAYLNGTVKEDGQITISTNIPNKAFWADNKETILSDMEEFKNKVIESIE